MSDAAFAGIERQLLGLLQRDFPLVEKPYLALAERLGTSETEVLGAVAGLKRSGLVRQISPVLDARRLGYQSTLVAMLVPQDNLTKAVSVVQQHPGISHAYERDHRLNLWVTLSAPVTMYLGAEVESLRQNAGAEIAVSLPAYRLFKIGAFFDAEGESLAPASQAGGALPHASQLNENERAVLNSVQTDLPLESCPFLDMARDAGLGVGDFLGQCSALLERGVMRRYGGSINHRKAGYQANAMVCWALPHGQVEVVGNQIATLKEVSHCYERLTCPEWRFNLFAMVHGITRQACEIVVQSAVEMTGAGDFIMLYSTREFKKTRIRYAV